VVTVAFVAVIVLPMVLLVSGVRPVVVDNRAATEWPGLGRGSILDRGTYESIDAYVVDRFPLRDRAVRLEAEIERATSVFDSVRPGAPAGADGWLYLPDTLDDSCDQPDPAGFLDRVDETAVEAEASGIPFIFVVVPDKAQVYPEHLPTGYSGPDAPECPRVWRAAVEDATGTRPWLVDLFPLLDDAARTSSDLIYHRTDTHWTDLGALVGIEAVVTSLSPEVFDRDDARVGPDKTAVYDLNRLLGLDDEETVPTWRVERPGVSLEVEESSDLDVIRSRATSTEAPLVPGTTVFVSDSFGLYEIDLLQPYFEDLVFIKWQHLEDHTIAEVVDTAPTAVVVQLVARNLDDGAADGPLARVREHLADA
jgi:hypothetical protein